MDSFHTKNLLRVGVIVLFLLYISFLFTQSENSPNKGLNLIQHDSYLEIIAPATFTATTSSHWIVSLPPHETGYEIGLAVNDFRQGKITNGDEITLVPNGKIVIQAGTSPVGSSFRINSCSGYLDEFQEINPPLTNECNNTSRLAPDKECADFLSSLPKCTAVINSMIPARLSVQCKNYILKNQSYNACLNNTEYRNEWRVYIKSLPTFTNQKNILLYDGEKKLIGEFQKEDK